MKLTITMKDPDGVYECIEQDVATSLVGLGLSGHELEAVRVARTKAVEAALEKWIEYSEYLSVEFDTDAMTATVVPRK